MLKRALVVFVMLAMAAFVFATDMADVALVIGVKGEVAASIREGTGEEMHEWLVEEAEMLPVNTEIMVQEESSLKFIHLHDNVEYTFKAETWLQITEDAVVSEQEFDSSALQMVSAKFELDKSMRQQVGAVISDFPQESQSSKELIDDSLFEKNDNHKFPSASTISKKELEPVSVMLALPVEIAQLLATDINALKVAGHLVEINTDVAGWVVIELTIDRSHELSSITLKGDSGYLPTRVLAVDISQNSMAHAWNFEKQNLLPQAAALWIQQASLGVELAGVHLDRLKTAMLAD